MGAWLHSLPHTMWKGRRVYAENVPWDHSNGNSTFHKRTDVTSTRFPQDLMMCFVTKTERVGGKKGFKSRAGPQGTEREKGHSKLLRPSGTTCSLHTSILSGTTSCQLSHISSPYHLFTALGSPTAHKAISMSPLPLGHSNHLFPGKACAACLPPFCIWPAPALNETITSAPTPQTSFSTTNR